MATYIQIETLIRDPALQQRVLWACRVAAESIVANQAATPLQLKWADRVRRRAEQAVNLTAICAQLFKDSAAQSTIGVDGTTTATDAQIQGRVNAIVAAEIDLTVL